MIKYWIIAPIITAIFSTSPAMPSRPFSNTSLTGKVIEESTKEPMEFVNVVLFLATDSSQVTGASTDKNGIFEFFNLSNGEYYLKISFIGFETAVTEKFLINTATQEVDLGTIEIEISLIELENVEITADKATYNTSIDRKVYNVEKDIISQTGSANEALQNIPSVSVDVNGEISLRGTSNITFFINGKPSVLLRKNSAVALQQIPANTIERIEVITNPSAKYKPQGVGGIINIVLKKNTRPGLNGTIITNVGNKSRYNANFTANYNPGKMNLFGSYGFRRTNNPRTATDSRINRISFNQIINYYDNSSSAFVKPFAHIANAGFEYSINEKDRIKISGSYFYQNSNHKYSSNTTLRDASQQIVNNFTTDRTNDEFEEEYEIGASFEHHFEKEDHAVQFELSVSGYDEKEDNYYDETHSLPASANVLSRNLIKKGGPLTEFYVEYAYPISEETELEAGYVGEFFRDDLRFLGENFNVQNNTWTKDLNKSNQFLFKQDIHALYVTLGHSIEAFSFLAGLRAEQALITSNRVTLDSKIPNDYFKLYPTFHLAYELSDFQELQLNYSRRVNRADSDEHNPFPEYSDPRNAEVGNPKLKPEQIHSVEFGYQLTNENFSLVPSIYYRYKFDAFTEIHQSINDSTLLTSFVNLSNDQSVGLEVILAGNVKEILSVNLSTNTFYHEIDATNLGFARDKSTISWNSKLAANINLTSSTLLQLNVHYRSSRLTPQGEYDPLYLLNFGMRQDLFNHKAFLTLSVSDVFRQLKWKSKIDTGVLSQTTSYERNSQIIYLGFTYHFGKSSKESTEDLKFEDKI